MDEPVDVTGTLLRDGAGFVLAADAGGRIALELPRVPVDLVAKRARVVGRRTARDTIAVEAIGPG